MWKVLERLAAAATVFEVRRIPVVRRFKGGRWRRMRRR